MSRAGPLAVKAGSGLVHARSLLAMSFEDRKVHAAKAIGKRDQEALLALVEARLIIQSSSKHTIASYRKGVSMLLEAWQGVDLLRPSQGAAELYVLNLTAPDREADPADNRMRHAVDDLGRRIGIRPLSPATVRQRVAAANYFYATLRWAGITDADPFANVILPNPPSRAEDRVKEKAYTHEELVQMLRVCVTDDDILVIYLGAHAGLRVSEMIALRWDEVDFRAGRLLVRDGKGGKSAWVTLSDELVEALLEVHRKRFTHQAPHGHVLRMRSRSYVYTRLKWLWERSFRSRDEPVPPYKGVHGLRHYAGVMFAREVSDLRKVRDHLRHSSLSTTEIYLGVANDVDEVKAWSLKSKSGRRKRRRDKAA